jgi:hypothetical protein
MQRMLTIGVIVGWIGVAPALYSDWNLIIRPWRLVAQTTGLIAAIAVLFVRIPPAPVVD